MRGGRYERRARRAHNQDRAKQWLDRAQGKMNDSPQVERERERYLTLKGDYEQAAKLGFAVIEKLPKDREGVVYLAYDLYYLGRYDEALALATKYEPIIPNDKDLALIAGYVHAHNGQNREALADYTRALERDPKMALGYANRGFILNDLKEPAQSVKDFSGRHPIAAGLRGKHTSDSLMPTCNCTGPKLRLISWTSLKRYWASRTRGIWRGLRLSARSRISLTPNRSTGSRCKRLPTISPRRSPTPTRYFICGASSRHWLR